MTNDERKRKEHDALIRSVDDKLSKIDDKILLARQMVGVLAEVRRVELHVARTKKER